MSSVAWLLVSVIVRELAVSVTVTPKDVVRFVPVPSTSRICRVVDGGNQGIPSI